MNGHSQTNGAHPQAQAPVASSSSQSTTAKAAPLFGQHPPQVSLNGHNTSSQAPSVASLPSQSQKSAAAEGKTKDCELADYLVRLLLSSLALLLLPELAF